MSLAASLKKRTVANAVVAHLLDHVVDDAHTADVPFTHRNERAAFRIFRVLGIGVGVNAAVLVDDKTDPKRRYGLYL